MPRFSIIRCLSGIAIKNRGDAYRILGLNSGASPKQIKKRFLELAKQNHPDLNQGDAKAASRMAKIKEAYDTLMEPEEHVTNNTEDEILSQWFRRMAYGVEPAHGNIYLTLEQAARGGSVSTMAIFHHDCAVCSGTGHRKGSHHMGRCSGCNGTGHISYRKGSFSVSSTCSKCFGSGTSPGDPCPECRGEGVLPPLRETVSVNLPKGVIDGMQLQVPQSGNKRAATTREDLLINVNIKKHDIFTLLPNGDLLMTAPITWATCILGGTFSVPTLDGPKATLRLPTNSNPGSVHKIKGKGFPIFGKQNKRGDLLVTLELRLPDSITQKQRECVEEFERLEQQKSSSRSSWGWWK